MRYKHDLKDYAFAATYGYITKELTDKNLPSITAIKAHTFGSVLEKGKTKSYNLSSWRRLKKEFGDFIGKSEEGSNDSSLYPYDMTLLVLIPSNRSGGCTEKTKHRWTMRRFGMWCADAPLSTNNNCFFRCYKDEETKGKKFTKNYCNKIRKQIDLDKDSEIPVEKIEDICKIIDLPTPIIISSEEKTDIKKDDNRLIFVLENHHYYRLKTQVEKCKKCGYTFVTSHSKEACQNRVKLIEKFKKNPLKPQRDADGYMKINIKNKTGDYKHIDEKGTNQSLISITDQDKQDKAFRKLCHQTIHYDIETKVIGGGNYGTFKDVLVGVAYYERKRLKTKIFKSIKDFLKFLEPLNSTKKYKYLNAYNGRSFDHYFAIHEYINDHSLKEMKLLLKDSQVLLGQIFNLKMIDINRHTTGSLDDNLKAIKAKVQKKEIDYSKINDYEKMDSEFRDKLISYLKADVLGLLEFTEAMIKENFYDSGLNILKYLSTSQMSYDIWRRFFLDNEYEIYAPNAKMENIYRKSIYGGKSLIYQPHFESKIIEENENVKKAILNYNHLSELKDDKGNKYIYIGKENDYADLVDHLIDLDAVSLYPSAMLRTYPIGKEIYTKVEVPEKLGIYLCEFINNIPDLLYPVLPYKNDKGDLKWFEKAGKGWYTSIDMEEARKYGYSIKVIEGYYWEKSAPVFKTYIEYYFKLKQSSSKGTPKYLISKLRMNGLYGKTLQRAIHETVEFFTHQDEIWDKIIMKDRIINELKVLGKDIYCKSYSEKDKIRDKDVTKPTQLGAFVLSYSRAIMNNYYFKINPDNKLEKHGYVTDTDSIIMPFKAVKEFLKHPKDGGIIANELNCMNYDISCDNGEAGKIIRLYGIQPKVYMCDYLVKVRDEKGDYGPKNEIITVMKRHMRFKGIPSQAIRINAINAKTYENMYNGEDYVLPKDDKLFNFKKVNIKTKPEENMFSIIKTQPEKTCKPPQNVQGILNIQRHLAARKR